MSNFHVSSRRKEEGGSCRGRSKTCPYETCPYRTCPYETCTSKYGFFAYTFSEADLRRLDKGLEAQVIELDELFKILSERNEKAREAGELSASEYLEVREAPGKAQESVRSLRRTIKEEKRGRGSNI